MMQLYSYYRSSASYRVRIALNLKGLSYEQHAVHLVKGEHKAPAYTAINPQAQVPTLVDGDFVLTQSMAIMEYLDEEYPANPILPQDLEQRAYVRQISLIQVADIHPLNNLKVLKYLSDELKVTPEQKTAWYHKWITLGFDGTEALLARSPHRGKFCCGDTPTMADACLIPQVYNARRYEMSLKPWPLISAIEKKCLELEAFIKASPEKQPDTPHDHIAPTMEG